QEVLEKIKSFSHPNINSILDYGEYNGRFFTVLEYAQGGALDDKLPNGRYRYLPMNDDEVLQVAREAIEALEACRNAGIIHRDIKPGNLFYKNLETLPGGKLKGSSLLLGDFGIASLFEVDSGMSKHLTETGARTEGYAAPEAYSGVIGPEYDYYSLGITLWALLTGKEPFVNEEGHALYPGQITLNTIQGKTVENLLSRSPQMSASMQKLIRGLLTVRHDKRWKKDEVTRHIAGGNVDVYNEERTLPLVEIGGESCASYQEIAQAIIKYPEEGKKFVFKGKLPAYLIKIDQKLADRILDLIDSYSAEKREDEGTVFIAYSLCPNIAFPLDHGLSINNLEEMFTVLNTAPEAILPFLRDEKRGFYAYLDAIGLSEQGRKVKEIVSAASGGIRAVPRIITAFQGNEITPFQDGINNELRLTAIEDLCALPDYLKERVMIFIERNYGLIPAWIENVSGKNIDNWLCLLVEQKDRIVRWGTWNYFTLFMQGLNDYDRIQKNGSFLLYEKAGRLGLYRCETNSYNRELLYGIEADGNRLVIQKADGTNVFNGIYAINLAEGFDENGVSVLPFLDEKRRMAVFDGTGFFYFNIITGEKEPRYALKDGEIELLAGLGTAVPVVNLARSLKEKNNFTDMNTLIECFWKKLFAEKNYKTGRDLLLLIGKDKMEGLSYSYDFYLSEIGFTHLKENSSNQALYCFQEALTLNPLGLDALGNSYNYNIAQSMPLEDCENAIEYLDKAIAITPEKHDPVLLKGVYLQNLGKYNEAIACLTIMLEFKVSNIERKIALETRAECYNALGMKDKANSDNAEAGRLKGP
ncbi:MAG: protein kinase, partial [Treponema sp.]|nr:protein kinase [Treponema sp.]